MNYPFLSPEVLAILGLIALIAGVVTGMKYVIIGVHRLHTIALTKKGQAALQVMLIMLVMALLLVTIFKR